MTLAVSGESPRKRVVAVFFRQCRALDQNPKGFFQLIQVFAAFFMELDVSIKLLGIMGSPLQASNPKLTKQIVQILGRG